MDIELLTVTLFVLFWLKNLFLKSSITYLGMHLCLHVFFLLFIISSRTLTEEGRFLFIYFKY